MSDPVEASRSMLNPQDVALASRRGQTVPGGPSQTIGEWLASFGVSFDDPKEVALQKIRQQAAMATPDGKMAAMAGAQQVPPMQGASMQEPQGAGLAGLMGR